MQGYRACQRCQQPCAGTFCSPCLQLLMQQQQQADTAAPAMGQLQPMQPMQAMPQQLTGGAGMAYAQGLPGGLAQQQGLGGLGGQLGPTADLAALQQQQQRMALLQANPMAMGDSLRQQQMQQLQIAQQQLLQQRQQGLGPGNSVLVQSWGLQAPQVQQAQYAALLAAQMHPAQALLQQAALQQGLGLGLNNPLAAQLAQLQRQQAQYQQLLRAQLQGNSGGGSSNSGGGRNRRSDSADGILTGSNSRKRQNRDNDSPRPKAQRSGERSGEKDPNTIVIHEGTEPGRTAAYVKHRVIEGQELRMTCHDAHTLGIAMKALALARLFLQEHRQELEIRVEGKDRSDDDVDAIFTIIAHPFDDPVWAAVRAEKEPEARKCGASTQERKLGRYLVSEIQNTSRVRLRALGVQAGVQACRSLVVAYEFGQEQRPAVEFFCLIRRVRAAADEPNSKPVTGCDTDNWLCPGCDRHNLHGDDSCLACGCLFPQNAQMKMAFDIKLFRAGTIGESAALAQPLRGQRRSRTPDSPARLTAPPRSAEPRRDETPERDSRRPEGTDRPAATDSAALGAPAAVPHPMSGGFFDFGKVETFPFLPLGGLGGVGGQRDDEPFLDFAPPRAPLPDTEANEQPGVDFGDSDTASP